MDMIAYFDCFAGISGDMTLGALIDLGVPRSWLVDELRALPLSGFDITVDRAMRNGIDAANVRVQDDDDARHRDWAHIRSLIEQSALAETVKISSLAVFEKIALAEAGIHGCEVERVHFHEVGGIDAIVDIVGTALALDYLKVTRVEVSHIPLGSGFVTCRHGILPLPSPATLKILAGLPVYGTHVSHELVTPTGAAIAAALGRSFGPMPPMQIVGTGYGAGKRELPDRPNLLRVVLGEAPEADTGDHIDTVAVLETCIDDMNPEVFGFVMERLFEQGALDVYWIPVFMKKNRPGTMVQVVCPMERRDDLSRCMFKETTTLGIRQTAVQRRLLKRELMTVQTSYGPVPVKRVTSPDGSMRLVPEYEACRAVALERSLPLRAVYDAVAREANEARGPHPDIES